MPIFALECELCRQGLWFINLCSSSFLKIPCRYWISVYGGKKNQKKQAIVEFLISGNLFKVLTLRIFNVADGKNGIIIFLVVVLAATCTHSIC